MSRTPPEPDLVDEPSIVLGRQCPAAIELLEHLDDTVFEAIAGKPAALDQLRGMWPEVLRRVGAGLVEESRAQYVRHAMHVWRHCLEGEELRNPRLALTVMEVIELLLEDCRPG